MASPARCSEQGMIGLVGAVGRVRRPAPRFQDELGFAKPDRNTMLDVKTGYRTQQLQVGFGLRSGPWPSVAVWERSCRD